MKKGDIEIDKLIGAIIALAVLAFGLILYFILTGKGGSAISYFKDMLRFGR